MQIFCISELGLVPNKSHPTLKSTTPQASKTTDEQQYTNLNMFKWLAKSLTTTCAVIVTISKQRDGLYNSLHGRTATGEHRINSSKK